MKLPCFTMLVTNVSAFRIGLIAGHFRDSVVIRVTRIFPGKNLFASRLALSSEDRSRAREVPEEFLLPTWNDITYLVGIAPATSPEIRAFVMRKIRCRFLRDRWPHTSGSRSPRFIRTLPVVTTSNIKLAYLEKIPFIPRDSHEYSDLCVTDNF